MALDEEYDFQFLTAFSFIRVRVRLVWLSSFRNKDVLLFRNFQGIPL